MRKIEAFYFVCLFFMAAFPAFSQGRGSIPEELLRPGRGESSRFPLDIVIGEIGQGRAPYAAYTYANLVAEGLLSGQMTHPALVSINPALRENYLNSLGKIAPRSYRLGGGRQEPDGAVSFLLRFIGRDYGITGELYLKLSAKEINENSESGINPQSSTAWIFDDFLLEEAMSHTAVNAEAANRLDILSYERFF